MKTTNRVQPDAAVPADLAMRRAFLTAMGLAISPAGLGRTWAEDVAVKPEEAAARLKEMEEVARSVSISELAEGKAAVPMELQAEPLFRFSNPTREATDATLWSWGRSGRPVALLKVVLYGAKPIVNKPGFWGLGVTALSPNTVKARFPNGDAWESRAPGVALQPLPGAPEPAASARQRANQMKIVARRITVTMHLTPNSNPTQLRLLPTPLLRYDDQAAGLHDGALFTFSEGTSPALILALEARANAAGEPTWHYGFGRTGGAEMTANLDGKQIWEQGFVKMPANAETYATRAIFPGRKGAGD